MWPREAVVSEAVVTEGKVALFLAEVRSAQAPQALNPRKPSWSKSLQGLVVLVKNKFPPRHFGQRPRVPSLTGDFSSVMAFWLCYHYY